MFMLNTVTKKKPRAAVPALNAQVTQTTAFIRSGQCAEFSLVTNGFLKTNTRKGFSDRFESYLLPV